MRARVIQDEAWEKLDHLKDERSQYSDRYKLAVAQAKQKIEDDFAYDRDNIDELILSAYALGANITQLCEAYGTTQRGIIIDLLKSRGVYIVDPRGRW